MKKIVKTGRFSAHVERPRKLTDSGGVSGTE